MAVKYRTKHGKREGKHTVVTSNNVMFKRDAGNAIVDTQRKTALAIFTASNGPTVVTLLLYLHDSQSKLPQQGHPY